jgi:hypothetical protein
LHGESNLTPPSQEAKPTGSEPSSSTKHKVEEVLKSPEVLFHEIRASLLGMNDPQVLSRFEAFMNLRQIVPHSTPATFVGTPNTIGQQHSMEIASPIASLTPLQTSFGNPNSVLTFIGDITPILPEDMPPSYFFFSKKQKAIMKRESHQKDRVITKRKRPVYDGKNHGGPEFAKEVAGSLGAFATANQWSMDNLIEQLRHKCLLVEKLQNEIYNTEHIVISRMNQNFEQIKTSHQQQIKHLQDNLYLLYQSS